MRNLVAAFAALAVASIALVSPEVPSAFAQTPTPAPTPAPAPSPPNCAACVQCVAVCGTTYAACTQKCLMLPNVASQQACVAACPSVAACAQACPCVGCASIPGLPH